MMMLNEVYSIMAVRRRGRKQFSKFDESDITTRKKLMAITKSIRNKHLKLRKARELEENFNERLSTPFIIPLKKLLQEKIEVKKEFEGTVPKTENSRKRNNVDEDEVFHPNMSDIKTNIINTSKTSRARILNPPNIINEPQTYEHIPDEDILDSTSEDILERSRKSFIESDPIVLEDFLRSYHKLPRKFLRFLMQGTDQSDTTYGVTYNSINDSFSLGNSKLIIKNDEPDIFLDRKRFVGTEGLYELLFKKNPIGFTEQDVEHYIQMLEISNAHKMKHDKVGRVKGCNSRKYQEIIKRGLEKYGTRKRALSTPQPRLGHGINSSTKNLGLSSLGLVDDRRIKHVFYRDPNDLVSRLKILLLSQEAGNDSHSMEINSLLTQLRELNIII